MMKQFVAVCLVLAISLCYLPIQAHAAQDIITPESFNGLDGDSEYIDSKYINNYHLDVESLGILDAGDKIINSISNAFFSFAYTIAKLSVTLFYYSMSLDIGSLIGTAINGIQTALVNGIFNTLFFISLAASLFYMGTQLGRHNLQGILGELGRVILIMGIATGVTLYSAQFLTAVNTMTKGISVTALSAVSGQNIDVDSGGYNSEIEQYSANAAGILWSNLMHQPWLTLEFYSFSNQPITDEMVHDILSNTPDSAARESVVKDLNNSNGFFAKEVVSHRLGLSLVIMVLVPAKALIFLAISALQLGFQLLSMLLMFMCPIVLLLALAPQYGGSQILTRWLKTLLEIQVSIVVLSLLIGLIILVDQGLYALAGSLGWLIVMVMQGLAIFLIFLFRNKILQMLSNFTRGMQNPQMMMRKMATAGNLYQHMGYAPQMGPRHIHKSTRSKMSVPQYQASPIQAPLIYAPISSTGDSSTGISAAPQVNTAQETATPQPVTAKPPVNSAGSAGAAMPREESPVNKQKLQAVQFETAKFTVRQEQQSNPIRQRPHLPNKNKDAEAERPTQIYSSQAVIFDAGTESKGTQRTQTANVHSANTTWADAEYREEQAQKRAFDVLGVYMPGQPIGEGQPPGQATTEVPRPKTAKPEAQETQPPQERQTTPETPQPLEQRGAVSATRMTDDSTAYIPQNQTGQNSPARLLSYADGQTIPPSTQNGQNDPLKSAKEQKTPVPNRQTSPQGQERQRKKAPRASSPRKNPHQKLQGETWLAQEQKAEAAALKQLKEEE